MIFGFVRKENIFLLQHYHPIRHIHCQKAASEFLTDFDSWDMLTIIGSRSPIRFLIGDLSSDTLFKNSALFTYWLESAFAQNGAQKYCHGQHNLFGNFSHLFRCFLVWKWEIGTFSVRNPQNSQYWFKSKPVNCTTTAFFFSFFL